MGVGYHLVEPINQVALDIDKAGFWLYADEDLPDPFTLADMLRLRPERTDVIAWMRAHCGDREVYILNDTDECFPPHSTGNFPWGVDGRVSGWRVYRGFGWASRVGVGYKLLRSDGKSLTRDCDAVTYAEIGAWQTIPGSGAFVGTDLRGILLGGFGPLLAEVEYRSGIDRDRSCVRAREVRVIRTATIDRWTLVRVAIRAMRDIDHVGGCTKTLDLAVTLERDRTMGACATTDARAGGDAGVGWDQVVNGLARRVASSATELVWASHESVWSEPPAMKAWVQSISATLDMVATAGKNNNINGMQARIVNYLVDESWPQQQPKEQR